jgi:hypothetical protein
MNNIEYISVMSKSVYTLNRKQKRNSDWKFGGGKNIRYLGIEEIGIGIRNYRSNILFQSYLRMKNELKNRIGNRTLGSQTFGP